MQSKLSNREHTTGIMVEKRGRSVDDDGSSPDTDVERRPNQVNQP